MAAKIQVEGTVISDPKVIEFPDGKKRFGFLLAEDKPLTTSPRRVTQKFHVNYGMVDERIQKGVQVIADGYLYVSNRGGRSYVNVDAYKVSVPNIKMAAKPMPVTRFHERKDASEWDIIRADMGYTEG